MDSGALILLLIVVYLPTQIHLYRLDIFFAAYYFYLFLYGIFAVTGYVYFPELSSAISAYFGPDIEQPALLFLILSFVSVYVGLLLAIQHRSPQRYVIAVARVRFGYPVVTLCITAVMLLALLLGLTAYGDEISYSNASDTEFVAAAGLWYRLWFTLFKISPVLLVVMYATLRYRLWESALAHNLLRLLFVASLAMFAKIAHLLGNRLDLVALFNAMLFVELIRQKGRPGGLSLRFFAKVAAVAVPCVGYMIWLASTRTHNPFEGLQPLHILIFQDYFAPAHMLFAAIAYQLTSVGEVLTSNVMNSLVLMNYPYLQEYVTEAFSPGVATRTTGYAFYVMTEGYLAFGFAGFLYNGAVLGMGMWLWRRLAVTDSGLFNAILLPLLAMDLVGLCRGQTAYFVKFIYFHFVPALLLIFCVTGFHIRALRLIPAGSRAPEPADLPGV